MHETTHETRREPVPEGPGPAASTRAPTVLSDRILLVEDNPLNQRVTVAMLDHLGFCVDVVDNGVEAVIAATMVPYRAILMDCQIPVLNGYEATSEIRSQWGASRSSPIIAVTASASASDRRRAVAAGMDGQLDKPLTIESLADAIARWAPDPTASTVAPDRRGPGAAVDHVPLVVGAEQPSLDPQVVRRLERLGEAAGEDLLGQLAIVFLSDADTRITAMRQAIAAGDGPALIHSAHTLCGASANLGAAHLSRLCARMATDGTVGDLTTGEVLLEAVEEELTRVRFALGAPAATPVLTLLPSSDPSPLPKPTPLP